MKAMEISRTGLEVEWRRLEVIAENLANASSSRVAGGQPYQPLRLVSGPSNGFAAHLGNSDERSVGGVTIYGIEQTGAAPRLVSEPGNPNADANGFVAYPGVDVTQEMLLMIKTQRTYESNLAALNMARQMYSKALELGRRA